MSDKALAILIAILGSGVLATIVTVVGQVITARQARRWAKEDAKREAERKDSADMAALKDGMKWILYDRIKYLGLSYVKDGVVDFDDRRVLRAMHSVYHNGLGGNGDLDLLMGEVNALDVKGGQKG